MKLVTRKTLGWPISAAPTQLTAKGVKVHYEGTEVSAKLTDDHALCLTEWQNIRKAHLANVAEGYSDVAYNYAACVHGYLLEGRGLHKRTGANGNQDLNRAHYAIVALIGSKGLTKPTDELLHAIRDGIELLRQNGAGAEVQGHRDGYATACPGAALYDWVQRGAPRPGGLPPVETKPATPKPVVDLSKLVTAAKLDPPKPGTPISYYGVKTVEAALVAEGLLSRRLADGHFGTATKTAYAAWQRSTAGGGFKGADADGIPGRSSLERLGKRRGFTVTA